MNQRKKDIEQAKTTAKERYSFCCVVCGSEEPFGTCWGPLDGAHIVPTNTPFRRYDPRDPDNIFPLHRSAHSTPGNDSYDECKTYEKRRDWILRRVTVSQEMLVKRLDWLYGETEAA